MIATYKLPKDGHALAISEGIDRVRAVDESGNQLAVFGRTDARTLSLDEQCKLYLRANRPWHDSDDPFDPDIYRPLTSSPFPPPPTPPPAFGSRSNRVPH